MKAMRFISFCRCLALLAISFFTVSSAYSQAWTDGSFSADDLRAIETTFRTKVSDCENCGKMGQKPFERILYFWEQRMSSEEGLKGADYWGEYQRTFGKNGYMTKSNGNWESLGMDSWISAFAANPGNGRINVITVDPNDEERIYIGTPNGGLWRSDNGGDSWEPLTDQLPTLGVSGIAIDPANSDIIYLATGDGNGLFSAYVGYGIGVLKSTDGGSTWNTTGLLWSLEQGIQCQGIMMHPENSQILFANTSNGLYRTLNGGLSWELVQPGNVWDVEFHPTNPDIIYASTNRLYKSVDGGDDFDPVSDEGLPSTSNVFRIEMAVTPDQPDYLYFVAANDTNYGLEGVYRSTDQGETWQLRADSPNLLSLPQDGTGVGGQGWYDLSIAVDPQDAQHVMIGGVNLWESTSGGLNWNLNAFWQVNPDFNYVHADIHYLGWQGDAFYSGSDGGIWRSVNDGDSFQNLSDGLVIAEYYRFGMDPNDSDFLLCGAQDNGSNLRNQDGDWFHVKGADGMEAIVHPTNPDILFAASQYGGIDRSLDGGDTFEFATPGIDENGAWITPYIMSPANPDVMYAGFESVWRSTDMASSWAPTSLEFGGNDVCRSLAMAASNPSVVYAASYDDIYRSEDAGGSWDEISDGLPNLDLTYIAVDPTNEDRLVVTFSAFSAGLKVYESVDGGMNWTNISTNLPNIPVNCVVIDPAQTDALYIGTDFGVFYTDDSLANWEPFNDGLPNVIVMELMINSVEDKLVAATYGRGMWRSDLWEPLTVAPSTAASFGPAFICEGDSIFFQDQSSGNAPGWNWNFTGGAPTTLDESSGWITFNDAGVYDFSLQTANDAGSDLFMCEGCIHVFDTLGIELPLAEGFENPDLQFTDGEWFASEDVNGSGWRITDQVSYGGDHAAWVNNYTLDLQETYDLTSQPLDLSENDSYTVTWRLAHAPITEETNDRLRLYTSTDCGDSWSLRSQYAVSSGTLSTSEPLTTSYVPADDEWEFFTFDLPESDLSSHTSLRFRFLSDNGNNIYLDNINIQVTSVDDFSAENGLLVVYPNPGDEQLNVRFPSRPGENVRAHVFDAMGRMVISQTFLTSEGESELRLDTSRLEAGTYGIQVHSGNQIFRSTWLHR